MEDEKYKKKILEMNIDMIDKSLGEDNVIDSDDPDYVMKKIREDYLLDSKVTIHLIGNKSAEIFGTEEQQYIKRELQASLYSGGNHHKSGILGVVLPSMYNSIFQGTYNCSICGGSHNTVKITDNTTVKEYNHNYYIPDPENGCSWSEDDRYCVLVKWDDFNNEPEKYIDQAFNKRQHPIADKVKVYPK